MPLKPLRTRAKPKLGASSLSDNAFAKLKDAIQDGTLTPGARVMEVEIAKWLKMSRTPVREALRRLEAQGIVTNEPRNGMVVTRLDRKAIMELYVIRENLEGLAARLCAQNASDMVIANLEHLLEEEQALQGNIEALVQHNFKFLNAIRRGADNRYLLQSFAIVTDTMYLVGGHIQESQPERATAKLKEHTAIVTAIRKRDPDAAERAARESVRAGQKERLKLLFSDSGD